MPQLARRSHAIAGLGALLTAAACSSTGGPEPTVDLAPVEATVDAKAAAATITAEEMMGHVSFLASDDLAGRDTPSPGLETAARYLADMFRTAGLEPAGDDGTYFQRWPYQPTTLRGAETFLAYGPRDGEAAERLIHGTDFFLVPTRMETVSAGATFLGPIESVLDDTPPGAEGKLIVVTTPPSMGAEFLVAGRRVAEAGGAGLIMILDPRVPAEAIGAVAGQIASAGLPLQPVPVLGLTQAAASDLFAAAGVDLEVATARADTSSSGPLSLPNLELTIEAPLARGEQSNPPNVVALLPGSDPELRHTYVVLSAHFDHVGIGAPDARGDSIYNGADDDASGTSLLLEVAEAMRAWSGAPARSVLFLAVSGEEKGLLGSSHFAAHPTVPLSSIVADINLDMIGRNAPDTVIAIGQEYTSLGPLAHRVARENPSLGLNVAEDPDPSEQAFFRSDHVAFVKRDIPSIFFTTWDHEDYHRPSDEVDRIDADKAARVARFVFLMTLEIAGDPSPPSWNPGALKEVREILRSSPF